MNITKIRDLIGKARLEEAISALDKLLPSHLKNDLLLLKSSLTSLKRDLMLGLLDRREESMIRARITNSILTLINELEEKDFRPSITSTSPNSTSNTSSNSSSVDFSTLSHQKGVILHSIPGKMQINNLHRCIIRVAFDKDTILKNLPVYAKNVVIRENVKITEEMEVDFEVNKYFEIKAINSTSQLIDEDEATEWNFDVAPLRLGRFPLTFKIKVILPNGKKEVVLTESIVVTSTPAKSTMTFVVSDLEAVRDSEIKITQIHHGSGDNVGGNKIVHEPQLKATEDSKKTIKSILFAAANPSNEARIETDLEHRTIKEEMQKGFHRDQFTFLPTQLAVRITELMRSFKDKPTIVHFAGHGVEEGIIVSNDQNQAQLLSDLTIQRLFKPLKGKTELILLNSCYSAFQAELISKIGMIVIGHNLPIGDAAAVGFSKGFYLGLSEGMTYEDAFNDGVTAVLAENDAYASVIEVWENGVKLDW